jgi:hypothetical protein
VYHQIKYGEFISQDDVEMTSPRQELMALSPDVASETVIAQVKSSSRKESAILSYGRID